LFPAFLDTCVLYSSTLRDTLLRIAEADAFRPLWSADVLAELKSVLEREAHLDSGKTSRLIGQLQQAFPASEVVDYDALIDAMTCHPKDRHVLAAAVAGGAQVVVTFNVKDFPPHRSNRTTLRSSTRMRSFLINLISIRVESVALWLAS
jgi:predicted nucleic acid-binding protein